MSSFWKEWPPAGKVLGCHKQDCQTKSHLFIPQSPKCLCSCCFCSHHQLCATCQPLASASNPPPLPSPGRKLGSERGRDLFRAPSKLGHAGIQPPRSRSRVLGTLPATSYLCCCSQLLQAGKGISSEAFPPGTSRWINYLRLCLALYQPPLRQLQSG